MAEETTHGADSCGLWFDERPQQQEYVENIGIPRRLFDQFSNDELLAKDFEAYLRRVSGAQIQITMQRRKDSPRHRVVSCAQNRRIGTAAVTTRPSISESSDIYRAITCYELSSLAVPIEQTCLSSEYPVMVEERCRQTEQKFLGQKRFEFFIQATGRQDQVAIAREETTRILRNNASSENRVTLKMDVSFSDHSFIIGRNGKGVQGAMRSTGCQIHFPDSNKNDRCQKSNQVSISGPPDAVMEARQKVRELLPISLAFRIDEDDYRSATIFTVALSERKAPELRPEIRQIIEALQNEFHMTITWIPMRDRPCAMVTVRGGRRNIARIREGVHQLNALLRPGKHPPTVYLAIEVTSQYVQYAYGNNGVKVQAIMDATNTEFSLAAGRWATSYHISTVRINGQVENVFRAWVAFMDLLPVAVLIDIPESGGFINTSSPCITSDNTNATMVTDVGAMPMKCTVEAQLGAQLSALVQNACPPQEWRPDQQQPNSAPLRLAFDELQVLENLGILSSEMLTSSVATQRPNGDIEILHSGLYHAISLAAAFTTILYHFEISLAVRPSRDSRSWKLEARGPESRVDLLMDVYRVLRNPNRHPVDSLRETVDSRIPTPRDFPHANIMLNPPPPALSTSLSSPHLSTPPFFPVKSTDAAYDRAPTFQGAGRYYASSRSRLCAPLRTGRPSAKPFNSPGISNSCLGQYDSADSAPAALLRQRSINSLCKPKATWQQGKGSLAAFGGYGLWNDGYSDSYGDNRPESNSSRLQSSEVENLTQSLSLSVI